MVFHCHSFSTEAALLQEWGGTFRTDLYVLYHLLYKLFYVVFLFFFAGKAYKRCDLGFLLHKILMQELYIYIKHWWIVFVLLVGFPFGEVNRIVGIWKPLTRQPEEVLNSKSQMYWSKLNRFSDFNLEHPICQTLCLVVVSQFSLFSFVFVKTRINIGFLFCFSPIPISSMCFPSLISAISHPVVPWQNDPNWRRRRVKRCGTKWCGTIPICEMFCEIDAASFICRPVRAIKTLYRMRGGLVRFVQFTDSLWGK